MRYFGGNKLLCANETLTEIIRSQSSWITFLNSLNTANINDNQSIKQFKKSTGLSVFSLTSIPYINGTKELFNFKIQFKVELKRGHDADILNLRYEKKTGEENHTRSRHHPKSFDMSTYLNAISVGFSKPEAAINNINLLVIQFPRNGCNACLQEEKSFAGGSIHSTSIVTRATDDKLYSRWSISRKEYPWDYYPPFFQGGCYILGADLVRDASIAMSFTQNLRFDDVFLGIVLARLNKSLTLLKEIQNLADGNSNAAEMIIMGRLKANKYFLNRN
ncbi:unnamed protein product [Heterobilharzia americana]|nr:unnamed protein product [Heterobilharzia americana]